MNVPFRSITTVASLKAAGLTADSDDGALEAVAERYAIAITPIMTALIDPADGADPIARQFVPTPAELQSRPHETPDPIADGPHSPVPGLVHRYRDRALLKLTTICPVYCRFCFRREMVGPTHGGTLDETALDAAFAYIRATPSLAEIIVTGGDPLILSARRIEEITRRLSAIAHVGAIRWHSRVPLVAPERVTGGLIAALAVPGRTVRIAVHANHPREFTPAACAALSNLTEAGIGLISQSVLLAGVNDDAATLADLVAAFRAAGVAPYYLHHLDPAPGTSHFHVPIARGQALLAQVAERLPGVGLPQYTLDIPGGYGKVAISPPHVVPTAPGVYRVRASSGHVCTYLDGR